MNVIEKQLHDFFGRVGQIHGVNIHQEINSYIGAMKLYPHIVESNVHKFKSYFENSPADNYPYVLNCLLILASEMPSCRETIIESMGSILYLLTPLWANTNCEQPSKKLLDILGVPLTLEDDFERQICRSILTLKKQIIIIVGAGFSYDTMPITNELQPLLVQVLKSIDVNEPVKLIENDIETTWRIIKDNSEYFKGAFSGWCARSLPSLQHKMVAKMLYSGQISHLISFNWDNLIERSYQEMYGELPLKVSDKKSVGAINSLWKMHGDIEDASSEWIYPYADGYVFDSLIDSLETIVREDCPQFVLIVGYSESERNVKSKLIDWLESNIPTVLRIRPGKSNGVPGLINETSKSFFGRLGIYLEKGN